MLQLYQFLFYAAEITLTTNPPVTRKVHVKLLMLSGNQNASSLLSEFNYYKLNENHRNPLLCEQAEVNYFPVAVFVYDPLDDTEAHRLIKHV